MEKYLTKEQVKVILQNAPQGIDGGQVVDGLVARGYKLEGFNDQPEAPKTMTGSEKAPFQATGEESIIGGTAKAVGNAPRSLLELGKNVTSAVLNPIDTVKSVGKVVQGVGAKVGELALENTDFGQKFLEKANQQRIAQGQPELQRDAQGKLQAIDTPELEAINTVGTFFKDRYGSIDKFKETAIEDPAGVLADVASLLTGGSAILGKAGLTNAATKTAKIAQTIEPITATGTAISKTSKAVKGTTPARVVSEMIPTATDLQKNSVVKALDLTQSDLSNIGKSTGNDVTEFIVSKGLIKETPEAIADALNTTRKDTMKLVRDEISKVDTVYTPEQVPNVTNGLNTILKGVEDVSGLENVSNEITSLLKKKELSLSDIQRAKELIDENSNIYSKIGDVKSGATARGLDNIRKDIKTFIENEVDTATGGQTNIQKLNNDVQTSYAIEDAINTRATRGLTRQKISLGDWAALGVGTTINPAVGIGLYLGKKVIETPSFRLAFTKALNARPIKEVKKIISEVKNKTVSKETQKVLNDIASEARKNVQLLETGSAIVDKTKSEKKPQKDQ